MALLLAEASLAYLSTMHNDQIRDICILHSAQKQYARNLACYSTHTSVIICTWGLTGPLHAFNLHSPVHWYFAQYMQISRELNSDSCNIQAKCKQNVVEHHRPAQ